MSAFNCHGDRTSHATIKPSVKIFISHMIDAETILQNT